MNTFDINSIDEKYYLAIDNHIKESEKCPNGEYFKKRLKFDETSNLVLFQVVCKRDIDELEQQKDKKMRLGYFPSETCIVLDKGSAKIIKEIRLFANPEQHQKLIRTATEYLHQGLGQIADEYTVSFRFEDIGSNEAFMKVIRKNHQATEATTPAGNLKDQQGADVVFYIVIDMLKNKAIGKLYRIIPPI